MIPPGHIRVQPGQRPVRQHGGGVGGGADTAVLYCTVLYSTVLYCRIIPVVVVVYRVLMVCYVDFCYTRGEKQIRDQLCRWPTQYNVISPSEGLC